ncbi:MAG: host attachment protein [Deltaproteobacteria bacterium]|nr:host attachment protein [Deltaproteobacteria bacterium]
MSRLWIMVADASVARIYATAARGAAMHLVDTIDHPQGRLKGIDLVTDRGGSSVSDSSPKRHAFEAHTPPLDVELDGYARRLADRLNDARKQDSFDGLILAMPPRLLGRVKASLSTETGRLIVQSLDQRLVDLTENELRVYLTPT